MKEKQAIEYSGIKVQRGYITVSILLGVTILMAVLLLLWYANQEPNVMRPVATLAENPGEKNTGQSNEEVSIISGSATDAGAAGGGIMTTPVTIDQYNDYSSHEAIAETLSIWSDDIDSPPSAQWVRQIPDEAIEHLVEANLVMRYEQFIRQVELRPQYEGSVVTGLLVIPRGQSGLDMLLNSGLLQNDIIYSVNDINLAAIKSSDGLPGSLIVELLKPPSTRLGVLRGGSEIQMTLGPEMLENAPE